jgi:hypothetical protein
METTLDDLVGKYGAAEGAKAYLEVQVYGRYTLPDGVVITCAFPDHRNELAAAFEVNDHG